MVYYVYLDPGLIRVAAASGDAGLSCLATLLRAIGENCCLAEFDDWRVSPAIKQQLAEAVPEGSDWSKRLKMLLARLEKQNRIIVALNSPEPHPPISDVASAEQQASTAELDIILTADAVTVTDPKTKVLGLFEFSGSHFDLTRSQCATNGVTLAGGEHSVADFYARFMRKLLRHAQRVEFMDRYFGDKYGDHFKFTFRALVREYALGRHEMSSSEIGVHTGQSARVPHCRVETATFHKDIKVKVEAYDMTGAGPTLPHERYLLTDQFALEIGRGLDLFDMNSGQNRDVSLSFKNLKEVEEVLNRAAASKLP